VCQYGEHVATGHQGDDLREIAAKHLVRIAVREQARRLGVPVVVGKGVH
jgi:hypothetical protein